MNVKKIAVVVSVLCAASVACAASDEIFAPGIASAAELPSAGTNSSSEEIASADELSETKFDLPVIENSIPLIAAARDGDAEKVRELLADGAEIDAHEKNGITALMAASLYSHEEIAEELLERGADVNAASRAGWTPLTFALCGRMSFDFIEKLLDKGAYPETRAKDGTSPMMIACARAADPQIIRLLYARGADIAVPRKTGDTPLHFVAQNASDAAAEIAEFLVKNRAPLWGRNAAGLTPLMTAAAISSRVGVIDVLLAADWRVDAKSTNGMTALMFAAGNPTPAALEIARRLADAGASFSTADDRGRNAYRVGLSAAHSLEMVRWLKNAERSSAEREMRARVAVQPAVKIVAGAAPIVRSKSKSGETEETGAENSEELNTEKTENSQEPQGQSEREIQEELEKEFRLKTLTFPSKAQNSTEKLSGKGNENSGIAPLANVDLASRRVSSSSLKGEQIKKTEMRPFKKRRETEKLRVQRKKDPVLVPPILLAAVNPTAAAPEIIAWLLEGGESLEARDTEGRNALICAVRYNSSPLAARALLEAEANPRVAFKKSSLLQLLRYNEVMENDDKEALAKFIRAAKKK